MSESLNWNPNGHDVGGAKMKPKWQRNRGLFAWAGAWVVAVAVAVAGWMGMAVARAAESDPKPAASVSAVAAAAAGVESPAGAWPKPVRAFVLAKEKQVRQVAERLGLEVAPEVDEYLKAAVAGDWPQAMGLYPAARDVVSGRGGGGEPSEKRLGAVSAAVLLEMQLAFELILQEDTALALRLGEALMASVPRGGVLFGGTDVGRGLPTVLSASHADGDPFLTLTQNALADGRYLEYLRAMYGGRLEVPSSKDSEKAFQEYLADAQRRYEHDQKFPSEPRQLKPGENVKVRQNRVEVGGQVAVMGINARLARTIFDRNPDRVFFVEESFPLDWMYPHLSPHGMVLKLNREPVRVLTEADVETDRAHWAAQQRVLLGDGLKPGLSVAELCGWVRKVEVDRNLAGFGGDAKFLQARALRGAYAKLRSAIAGLYAWREGKATDKAEKARMARAAEAAFQQAFAFGPTTAEAVLRYGQFLVDAGRKAEALQVLDLAVELDPGMDGAASLAARLRAVDGAGAEGAPGRKRDN